MDDDRPTSATAEPSADFGSVTAAMVQSLAETRPWVRFIAILGFVVAGMMVLCGFFMFALGTFAQGMASDLGLGGFLIGVVYAGLYIVIAALYVWISYYLYRYATAIRELQTSGSTASLELALDSQRAFWRLVGIMTAIYIGFLLLAVIIGIIAAIIFGIASANA